MFSVSCLLTKSVFGFQNHELNVLSRRSTLAPKSVTDNSRQYPLEIDFLLIFRFIQSIKIHSLRNTNSKTRRSFSPVSPDFLFKKFYSPRANGRQNIDIFMSDMV